MNFLEERIAKDGVVKEGNILKVDSFLNHQMDIKLFNQMGEEFKKRFADKKINKIPIAIITKVKAFEIPKSVLSTPEVVVELVDVVVDFAFVEVWLVTLFPEVAFLDEEFSVTFSSSVELSTPFETSFSVSLEVSFLEELFVDELDVELSDSSSITDVFVAAKTIFPTIKVSAINKTIIFFKLDIIISILSKLIYIIIHKNYKKV